MAQDASPDDPPQPPNPSLDERLIRYLRDGESQAIDQIIRAYWPTVMSVCRRYHPDVYEAEDAAQETFLRLLRYAPDIRSHLGAWLKTTARSVCINHIRKAARQRDLIENVAVTSEPPPASPASRHRVHAKLEEAIAEIDPDMRQLIVERFWKLTPLRVLAGKSRTSIATVHRQLKKGVAQTADVLRDMGIDEVDDLTRQNLIDQIANDRFRQDPHWPRPEGADTPQLTFPGWTRPIRVGTLVSHHSQITPSVTGVYTQQDETAFMMRFVTDPRFELVSIIDPGTDEVGGVEQVIREYEFYDGLMYSNDLESLKTLDVIVVGLCFSLQPEALRSIRLAVDAGVGFFNDGWLAGARFGLDHSDFTALSLSLPTEPTQQHLCAAKQITPHLECWELDPDWTAGTITVKTHHPATPSWSPGQTFGCGICSGPLTAALVPGSMVIAERENRFPNQVVCKSPYLVAGACGQGRVLLLNTVWGYRHVPQWTSDLSWASDALRWLAEPQRETIG